MKPALSRCDIIFVSPVTPIRSATAVRLSDHRGEVWARNLKRRTAKALERSRSTGAGRPHRVRRTMSVDQR